MKRFVVLVDDATVVQQNAVTTWLSTTKFGYWHHFTDMWLVVAYGTDTWNAALLRDRLLAEVPGATMMVMGVANAHDWAGFGPPEVFKWVNDTFPVER